jgi:hypothetical protein
MTCPTQKRQNTRPTRHTTAMDDVQFYSLLQMTIRGAQTDGMGQQELAACLQPLIYPESLDLKPLAAARMLGLSVSTLETYRWRGTGPSYFHDDSGRVYYPWSALVEYRQQQRQRNMRQRGMVSKAEQYPKTPAPEAVTA